MSRTAKIIEKKARSAIGKNRKKGLFLIPVNAAIFWDQLPE
jgi:hypothetical protein